MKTGAGVVVDVRPETETEICCLDNIVNIPLTTLQYPGQDWDQVKERLTAGDDQDIYVICRRGNDSQIATKLLRTLLPGINIRDVIGGLHAWTKYIDSNFPRY